MSLDFVGPDAICSKVFALVARYEELCNIITEKRPFPDLGSFGNEPTSSSVDIENKYYRARLNAFFNRSIDDITEALVIVCDDSEVPNISSKFSDIGDAAFERNINLRLLVTVHQAEEDFTQSDRENVINWSLDRGFEHVEIHLGNLMEDYLGRDKIGLPRLMEALQSTMWSSMEKKSASSSSVRRANNEITESKEGAAERPNLQTVFNLPETAEVPLQSNPTAIDSHDPADDSDDDIKMFDAFASALSEARSIRDQARQGDMSDDERRRRAADMAMRLMEMLNLDDEGDD